MAEMTYRAYGYASGHIGFTTGSIPSGALPICVGDKDVIEQAIQGTARLAYDNETWLVPGVPEADDDNAALDAFNDYCRLIKGRIARLVRDAA